MLIVLTLISTLIQNTWIEALRPPDLLWFALYTGKHGIHIDYNKSNATSGKSDREFFSVLSVPLSYLRVNSLTKWEIRMSRSFDSELLE
jgi:hypothetical protein